MNRILAAAATAALLATGAFAQTAATDTGVAAEPGAAWEQGRWQENVSHMQEMVAAELARIGVDADVETLTLRQLNELALAVDDDSLSEQERVDQVRLILDN